MQESLLEINTDIKSTRYNIIQIEKSLNTLPEKDEFTSPTKNNERENFSGRMHDYDRQVYRTEIEFDYGAILTGAEPGQRNSFKSVSTQVPDKFPKKDTPEKSVNTTNNTKATIKSFEGNDDSGTRKT